jgi:hypothetical protein
MLSKKADLILGPVMTISMIEATDMNKVLWFYRGNDLVKFNKIKTQPS